MRPIRILMTTLLVSGLASLGYARPPAPVAAQSLGALAFGYAAGSAQQQDDQKPKEPDAKPSRTDKQDKPAKQQEPAKTEKSKDQDQKQDKNVAKQDQREDQKQDRNVARQDQRDDKSQQGKGGRIPDKDFKAHFGQEHTFSARRVVTTTTIVPNQTQFVYSGYTFVFVDAWPAGWAMDDNCYIDYSGGGYFLLDVAHPGVQIALTIVG